MDDKPHKGTIRGWATVPCFDGLGYCIIGITKHDAFIRTSFVTKRDGDQIETNNSRYTLVGTL